MTQNERNGEQRELLVGEIYRSILGAAPLRHALRELAIQTKSDKAFWSVCDLQRGTSQIIDSHNLAPEFIEKYSTTAPFHDLWLSKTQYYQAEGLIWRGSRILPLPDLVASSFYADFLGPQQIFHTLHIVVLAGAGKVARVLLSRPEQEPDFGLKDIEIARCFAFHARQALESHWAVAGQAMVRAGLAAVISDAALGVAILDPPKVIYTTEICDRILAALGGPAGTKYKGSRSLTAAVYFPRVVAEAINSHHNGGVKRLIVSTPDQEKNVLVNIKSVSYRGPAEVDKRLIVVSFFDLDQKVPIDQDLLQSTYDLTASEVRICALLANNESVESISTKLGITPNTARTHIKRIFSKTGAVRQSELVKLIMSTATLQRNGFDGTLPEETIDAGSLR
jgi:DNA-binding CsgD family transcriptional regulator